MLVCGSWVTSRAANGCNEGADDVRLLRWPTRDRTRTGEGVMGQLIDEIITLLALGDTRHPKE